MSSANEHLISIEEAKDLIGQIHQNGLIDRQDTSYVIYDLRRLKSKIKEVAEAFPDDWRHAIAIKSNPLLGVLKCAGDFGFGLEAASFEEVCISNRVKPPFTIWDSPAKTSSEISEALSNNSSLFINANSLSELKDLCTKHQSNGNFGLRINPEMELSSIASMTVGGSGSKFGEPISNSSEIISFFQNQHDKLGLHVHASSQNSNLNEAVSAIKKVCELAIEIGTHRISHINIGGGFPANYGFEESPSIQKLTDLLRANCPLLFEGEIQIQTEFGRFYHANAGFTASIINEVKTQNGSQTIIHHLGADMFLRESYEPGKWQHRLAILDNELELKTENILPTNVGGPLCFGGDYLSKKSMIPAALEADTLLIMDTGANSFSLWSMHCSRTFPKVIGIDMDGIPFVLKKRQNIDDILKFWE